ncbi:hypothetical protein Hanom_Chr13g01228471 [Helianthus anomalus]
MWFWRETEWVIFFVNGLCGIRILTRLYIPSKIQNPLFLSFNNTNRTPFLCRPSQNPSAADTSSSKKNRHQTPISHLHYRYDYVFLHTKNPNSIIFSAKIGKGEWVMVCCFYHR